MSVVGIDFGNRFSVIAEAKRGGIDVLLNENSKRLNTSAAVYVGNERFFGEATVPHMRSQLKSTATGLKRLIGRKFQDPVVQAEKANFEAAEIVPVPEAGDTAGYRLNYDGSKRILPAAHPMGSLVRRLLQIVDERAAESTPGAAASKRGASDLVISVPPYYNNRQRAAVLDACNVAGATVLKLMNENTAIALGYGFFRQAKEPFDDQVDTRILFTDAGESSFTASVVSYKNKQARVLGCAWDLDAGSRNVDHALARKLADDFKAKTGLDAWASPKRRLKLVAAAEKAKKELSPYGVDKVTVNCECLMEDHDLHSSISVEELDAACADVVARVERTIAEALRRADTPGKGLESCELVGGGVRVRCIKRAIARAASIDDYDEATGKGLKTSLNQDEAVARGCALQCAMLSPKFRVKEFMVTDAVHLPVRLRWEKTTNEAEEAGAEGEEAPAAKRGQSDCLIFGEGAACPSTKRLTFRRREDFVVRAEYAFDSAADVPAGSGLVLAEAETDGEAAAAAGGAGAGTLDTLIGNFKLSAFPEPNDTEKAGEEVFDPEGKKLGPKVRVDFVHDIHGLFGVSAATLLRPFYPKPEPVAAPEAPAAAEGADKKAEEEAKPAAEEGAEKKEGEEEAKPAAEGEEAKPAAEGEEEAKPTAEGEEAKPAAEGEEAAKPAAEGEEAAKPAAEGEEAAKPAEEAAKPAEEAAKPAEEGPRKHKWQRNNLRWDAPDYAGGMAREALQGVVDVEKQMQKLDELIRRTQAKRNEVESYVYAMRSRVGEGGDLCDFFESGDRDTFMAELADAEDWVCYGDGEDADLAELEARLKALHARGDPAQLRKAEADSRPEALAELIGRATHFLDVAKNTGEVYEHLTPEDRDGLRSFARAAEAWARDVQDRHASLPKTADPTVTTKEISAKMHQLNRDCDPIANKPKPAPKEEKKEEAKPAAEEGAEKKEGEEEAKPAAEGEEAKPAAEGEEAAAPAAAEGEEAKPAAEGEEAAAPAAAEGEEAKPAEEAAE